jgi:hypothetical protein
MTEEIVLARLMDAERELASRALRRHRVWREAVERGASARAQRALRRSWERARDDALIELGVAQTSARPKPATARRTTQATRARSGATRPAKRTSA